MLAVLFRKMLPNPMRSSQAAAPDLNNMPDECRLKISDRMRNKMPERCQIDCQKICEMICQDISGFFKKTNHPVTLIAKKLACPLSPNSMLLHRFAWKGLQKNNHFGSDAGMHWATALIKGARRDQCDVTTCRRMVVFC